MAKILVIEDNISLGQLYASTLRMANSNYEIRLACTGEDGVEQALQDPPDLVILDLMLPGISGEEVAHILKEVGIIPDTPLIIASALGEVAQVFAQSLNAAACLAKPFHVNLMLSTVQRTLAASERTSSST